MASVLNGLRLSTASSSLLASATLSSAQAPAALKPYVTEDSLAIVLMHVRVIDGTGTAAVEDDIENVQLIFKDGIGFDPAKLAQSVQGLVGRR
jgi:hypothetical protein